MEILQTSFAQWAEESPIAVTLHDFEDIEDYTAFLRRTQDASLDEPSNPEVYLNSSFEKHYAGAALLHSHMDFIEISYVHSGIGIATLNNTKRILQKGDIICTQVGDRHANYPLSSFTVYNCLVSSTLLSHKHLFYEPVVSENGRLNLPSFSTPQGSTLLQIENLFKAMLSEHSQKEPGYEDMLIYHLNELFVYLHRTSQNKGSKQHHTISLLLDYIAANYKDISLTKLAEHSSYTATYLSRLFHKSMGVNFTEYVNRIRIDEAIKLIIQSDHSIEEISHMVGFDSKLHFYEVFKKHVGLTPGSLRKQR